MPDVLVLPRGTERVQRGAWWPAADGARRSASITCPECGRSALLDHDIAADGTVSPSVECPSPGCTWHVFVRLEGWSP